MKNVYEFMLNFVDENFGGWPYRERGQEYAEVCCRVNGHEVCAVTYKSKERVIGGVYPQDQDYEFDLNQARAFEINSCEWFLEGRAFAPIEPWEFAENAYGDVVKRGFYEDHEAVKEIFREIGWEG